MNQSDSTILYVLNEDVQISFVANDILVRSSDGEGIRSSHQKLVCDTLKLFEQAISIDVAREILFSELTTSTDQFLDALISQSIITQSLDGTRARSGLLFEAIRSALRVQVSDMYLYPSGLEKSKSLRVESCLIGCLLYTSPSPRD